MKKYISYTSLNSEGNICQTLIDPENIGEIDLEVDINSLIFNYYNNVVNYMISRKDIMHKNNITFVETTDRDYSIGIITEIYEKILNSKKINSIGYENLYNEINLVIDNNTEFIEKNKSIFRDGIVVSKDISKLNK